jgi:hypothetical protein
MQGKNIVHIASRSDRGARKDLRELIFKRVRHRWLVYPSGEIFEDGHRLMARGTRVRRDPGNTNSFELSGSEIREGEEVALSLRLGLWIHTWDRKRVHIGGLPLGKEMSREIK